MRILVSNDDGYQARGIRSLVEALRQFGELTIVAPKSAQSGMSMAVTMGFKPICSAFCSTKRVCGIGPSKASTNSRQPSAMFSTRSTSPPKSACPGVSIMLIFVPFQLMLTFFERIVIPRSRSKSLASSTCDELS